MGENCTTATLKSFWYYLNRRQTEVILEKINAEKMEANEVQFTVQKKKGTN